MQSLQISFHMIHVLLDHFDSLQSIVRFGCALNHLLNSYGFVVF